MYRFWPTPQRSTLLCQKSNWQEVISTHSKLYYGTKISKDGDSICSLITCTQRNRGRRHIGRRAVEPPLPAHRPIPGQDMNYTRLKLYNYVCKTIIMYDHIGRMMIMYNRCLISSDCSKLTISFLEKRFPMMLRILGETWFVGKFCDILSKLDVWRA